MEVTDDERRRVAERLRRLNAPSLIALMSILGVSVRDMCTRLADLIDPGDTSQARRDTVACDPTERGIDSIYEWCRERLEGADGAEDELYCAIMSAIQDYRHPERLYARTVRAVDRDALLALEDEMRRNTQGMLSDDKVDASDIWYYEHLLRKACGKTGTGPTGPADRDDASRSPLCGHCECAPWCDRGPGPDGDCRTFEPRVGEGEPPHNLYSLYEAVLGRRPRDEFAIEDDEVEELVGALIDVCNAPGHEVIERAGSR